ncbi:MAG: glycoside hydrolase family 130 protein [Tepidisphaeraceae bacterium]
MIRTFATLVLSIASTSMAQTLPDWAIGPFTRPNHTEPVIRPSAETSFACPLRKEAVKWEALHTFNPGAVLHDGKICVLYRAEDASGTMRIGGHTSRIGLATSDDGIHFNRSPTPVLFPADDEQKPFEWTGGCEDPRIARRDDGLYVVTYTQYNGNGKMRLGIASSRDLKTWTKHGSAFAGTRFENLATKSASVVHEVRNGELVATRIDGRYWMYFGESAVNVATSDDLIHWTPVEASGELLRVMSPRAGKFDSLLTEVGPQVVRTDRGIILIYNGKNADDGQHDPTLPASVYACGQALFDRADPTKLLERLDTPFFKPELSWEQSGQYTAGTTFAEGLVFRNGRWFLYYGCADSFVGVAVSGK